MEERRRGDGEGCGLCASGRDIDLFDVYPSSIQGRSVVDALTEPTTLDRTGFEHILSSSSQYPTNAINKNHGVV